MKDYDKYITKQLHANPSEEEIAVAMLLVDTYSWKILFLAENVSEGMQTPDFAVGNLSWEIKSPRKTGKYTLPHAVKAAAHQSPNIVISLVEFEGDELNAIRRLEKEFKASKRIRRMKIVTKTQAVLDFEK